MKFYFQKLIVLLKRLSILWVIYQVLRLIFFFYNRHHFQEVGVGRLLKIMWGGLRFDTTGLLYLNLLYIALYLIPFPFSEHKLYKKILFFWFLVTNGLGLAFNIIDIFYFDYVLKRSTVEIFMFAGEQNIGILFWQFLQDFWWGFILFFLLLYLIIKWYHLMKDPKKEFGFSFKKIAFGFLVLLLTLYFSVVGIRGGFTRTTRPININNAGAYVQKPLEMAIVLNTPFTIIRTLQKQTFKPIHYFLEKEVSQIYTPEKSYQFDTIMNRKNVVIIIVESLAKEYSGLLNKNIEQYKGYTPFLDSLMLHSLTFTKAYANGRKSIDAMPSVLASVPSLVQPFVLSPYATDKLSGIGSILKKKGYKTAFFHGAPNGSMGFDAITNLAGFDEYYGMNEYGNTTDSDGKWGIPDDKFLQYMAKTLDTFHQPFAVTVFTLSSHHPFQLPKGFENKFKGGPLPIHKVVQYTDYSLRHFFQSVSKMPWYRNTLFIITADHCNQSYLPNYQSSVGRHAIPIIFFDPMEQQSVKLDSTLTQQIDIMPRLLWKLHYSGDFFSFGNSPNQTYPPFTVNYSGNTWEYMAGNYLLRFRNDRSVGLYNYPKDSLLNHNIINSNKKLSKKMEKRLKAFIQQYKNRLIENRLTIKHTLNL